MMNKFQKTFLKTLTVLFCLFAVNTSDAQTKLWGVGAPVGQADAQFSNAFVQSTTPGSYSTTQWTALSVNQSDGTVTPGSAFWVRNLTGLSQGAYATNMVAATSASVSNGVALFDSDYMDNNGTVGAFGTGTSPSAHRGELISPRIDLTGATDSALLISFYSYYRRFQITDITVSVSTDDGATWGSDVSIMALQPVAVNSATQGIVQATFPNATAGVSNLTQCRIRFVFDGDYYYSILDDITIQMAPEYDIAIGVPDANAPSYFGVGSFVRIGGNYYNPLVNIDATDLKEWFSGVKVINKGFRDILPSANPRAKVAIDFVSAVTGLTTYNVYLDTIMGGPTDSILADDLNGLGFVDYLREIDFIKVNGTGTYNVKYWVEHDNADGSPLNDTLKTAFVITDDAGGTSSHYISKARRSAADGRVLGGSQVFPGGGPFSAFEYGSLYYFPKGATDTIGIDSLEFRYYVPSAFTGLTSQTLLVNIYQFVDGSNGGNANGFVSGEELTQIGIATATLNGLGTTVPLGGRAIKTVTGFVDASSGGAMQPFVNGGFYYFSVLNQPSLFGGPATFAFNDVPVLAVDAMNYAMNIGMTDPTAPIQVSTLRIIDAAGTTNWYAGFNGFDRVPSIGLHLSASPMFTGTNTILEAENANLMVYPNPTSGLLNIDIKFNEATDVQYIITDITGKVYYMNSNKNVSNEIHSVDVSSLPAGVYLITAQTDKGVSTERFVKE